MGVEVVFKRRGRFNMRDVYGTGIGNVEFLET